MLYTREHTWAETTPEARVRVGLSDYICTCKELREIVHVWTETIGGRVKQMEPLGVVETWRFVLDIYAPVSGRLIELNGKIMDNPSIISEDPYGSGWIAEIEPTNLENEIKGLLSSMEYEQYCNELCLACPKKNCPLSSSV
jgi:glycine cleavage system H protein